MKLYYDLHLHSCLSPCGSDDMTPADLAAMCALAGLDVVALTDHNTAVTAPPSAGRRSATACWHWRAWSCVPGKRSI